MTIHKIGRRHVPVRVSINRQEKTVTSVPVDNNGRHSIENQQMETFYDFVAVSKFVWKSELWIFSWNFCKFINLKLGNRNLQKWRRLLRRRIGRSDLWPTFGGHSSSIDARNDGPTRAKDTLRHQRNCKFIYIFLKINLKKLFIFFNRWRWLQPINDWATFVKTTKSTCSFAI